MNGSILPTPEQSRSFWRQILQDDNEIAELIELWKLLWYEGMTSEERTTALSKHAQRIREVMRQYDLSDRNDTQTANQILIDKDLAESDKITEVATRLRQLLEKRRQRKLQQQPSSSSSVVGSNP